MKGISRKLVIGDTHGGLRALVQVLERVGYNKLHDQLIFLGDYVDGWGESYELMDFLVDLQAQSGNHIFVRGNHDVMFYDWLVKGIDHLVWRMNGGESTMKSYIGNGMVNNKEHAKFYVDMVDWYLDDDNNIFIHGGWDYRADAFPMSALYPVNAGFEAKECHWDRSLLSGAKSGHKSKTGLNAIKGFNKVFIGHTATDSYLPEKYCNLWNIDSGAGWSGKLTIMDVDTEEYWQSDFVKSLYPQEKGR